MTFSAIVTSHAFERGLRHMLGNLIYQTRKPDEIIVLWSDNPGMDELEEEFSGHVDRWVECQNQNDAGHSKRAMGAELSSCDYMGWFNDDDRYDRTYVEKMMALADVGAGAVYCDWDRFSDCAFRSGSSTSGNFIVAREIMREVGYPWREYSADGHLLNAIAAKVTPAKVREVLYFWNALER